MPITPSNSSNLTQQDTFKPEKNYTTVRHQQGKSERDINWNDGYDYIRHHINRYSQALLGYSKHTIFPNEFSVRPVIDDTATDVRNTDNFAVTLGRLVSKFGLIDTEVLTAEGLTDFVVYDYQLLVDNAATIAADRPHANAIFTGTITTVGTTSEVRDLNKLFHANHRLTSTSVTLTIPGLSAAGPFPEPSAVVDPWEIRFEEPACRVVALTGANAGEVRSISVVEATKLTVSSPFSNAFSVGDTYVVIPGNALTAHRALYDAATTQGETDINQGLDGAWLNLIYVQSFEDDISTSEDPDLKWPGLEEEFIHTIKLRWAVRCVNIRVSQDVNASRSVIRNVHAKNLMSKFSVDSGVGFYRHRNLLNDGDTSDLEGAAFGNGWRTEGGWKWDDVGLNKAQNVTRGHFFINDSLSLLEQGSANFYLEAIQASMYVGLVNESLSVSDYSVLCITAPQSKTAADPANETLSEFFHPARTQTLGTPIDHNRLSLYSDIKDQVDTLHEALLISPTPILERSADVALDITRSRAIGFNHTQIGTSGKVGGLLVEEHSGAYSPLLYSSLSEHLSAIHTELLGITGLGNLLGRSHHRNDVDTSANEFRIPSGNNFIYTGHDDSLAQSGQTNKTFTWATTKQLNPSVKTQGSVSPIDPLMGDTDVSADEYETFGDFIKGPGQYKLREDGTTITPSHAQGWSHYKDPTLVSTSTPQDSAIERRNWEYGKVQAMLARQALNFRKLAVKSNYYNQSDLYNYWVGDPTNLSEAATPYLQDDGDKDGTGFSAVGAIQNNSLTQKATFHDPSNRNSYSSQNTMFNEGYAGTDTPARGSQSVEFVDDPAQPAPVVMSTTAGPWGRFEKLSTDMSDQWENRCTCMRLRYHIGDYYPGPAGEGGVNTNALIDTLNLFVRIEPLSLAHWATMPRHMHPVLQRSLNNATGLAAYINFLEGLGSTSHLLSGAGVPLVTAYSPTRAGLNEGDEDWHNEPMAYENQPFLHWYRPNMNYITAPFPMGSEYGDPSYTKYSIYNKFGERSMIIPAIVHSPITTINQYANLNDTDSDPIENFKATGFATVQLSDEDYHGSHGYNDNGAAASASGSTTLDDTVTVVGDDEDNVYFPHNPYDTAGAFPQNTAGLPGPVFIPAYRAFSGHSATLPTDQNFKLCPMFEAYDGTRTSEYTYWPRTDKLDTGTGIYGQGTVQTNSAFDWKVPVLRANLRTDTVAAIVQLVKTSFNWPKTGYVVDTASDQPGSGPETPSDTMFSGDLGTSFCLDITSAQRRSLYPNPLSFGGVFTTYAGANGRPSNLEGGANEIYDYFDVALTERQAGVASQAEFIPLINTLVATKQMGMQQKLLWNSSFRVLHSRPSGGAHDGLGRPNRAGKVTSLTELFVVRDRAARAAKPLPRAPSNPEDKIFIHLESIHPSAAGGTGFNIHPNNALIGHLYPMISDSIGGFSESASGLTDLYDDSPTLDTRISAAEFSQVQYKTGLTGDTFVGDPYDYEYSHAQDSASQVPWNDRLQQNSGIEIDLVSELRYVRENAAAHGLDQSGTPSGKTWLDMMPTVPELTAPGDHEILFILYTGKYGQKMVDTTVPDGYNPPVSGCHVVASVEVNRPNEKISSANSGTGKHYGESREVYNILGHN
jgi:hypothetical protein